jgi:hypothetical protein
MNRNRKLRITLLDSALPVIRLRARSPIVAQVVNLRFCFPKRIAS